MKFVFILLITLVLFVSCGSSDDPATTCYVQNDCNVDQYCDFSANEYNSAGEKTGTCTNTNFCSTKNDCAYNFECIDSYCKPAKETPDIDNISPDTSTPDEDIDAETDMDSATDSEPDETIIDDDNISEPVCGNGIQEEGEACDDGNNAGADYCSSDCQTVLGSCGDGKIQENEACDDSNTDDNDYCSANCQLVTGRCGDGNVQANEKCDDSNTNDNDYCSSDCQTISGTCGDGTVQSNEACDDGNLDDGDYCSSDCQTENGYCGDGYKQTTEACDDGNSVETDYCSSTCTVIGLCGDGTVQSNEACDDGNTVDDETCSADCMDVPLKIETTLPANNNLAVSTASDIVITFNEPVDCDTAKDGGITINGIDVENSIITCNDLAKTVTIDYTFEQGTEYTVVVTTAVTDQNSYALKTPYEFSFKTVSVIQNVTYTANAVTVLFSVPVNCEGDSTTTGSIKKELTVKWDDDGDSSTGDVYINGAVTCNALEKTATFTPVSGSFDYYNKLHTVKINGTLLGTGATGTVLGQSGYTETYKIKRYFYDGFENGNSKWIFEDKSGSNKMTWAIGETTVTGSSYPGKAYKGINVLATNLDGYYNHAEDSYANINSTFSANSDKVELTFFAFVNMQATSCDYFQVISKDLNTNQETAMNIACIEHSTYSSLNGTKIGGSYSTSGYLKYKVSLASMNGKDFGIKFLFHSDAYTSYPGIYIDEVQVVEEERIISQE